VRVTLRRLDLAAEIYHLREPQKIPRVMSPDETRRLLAVASGFGLSVERDIEISREDLPTRAVVEFDDVTLGMLLIFMASSLPSSCRLGISISAGRARRRPTASAVVRLLASTQ
jgi:hypothetical protein